MKALVTDRHTWFSLLYMALQLPLGILYFTLNSVLLTLAIGLIFTPIGQVILKTPIISFQMDRIFLPMWALLLVSIGGFHPVDPDHASGARHRLAAWTIREGAAGQLIIQKAENKKRKSSYLRLPLFCAPASGRIFTRRLTQTLKLKVRLVHE